MKTRRPLDLGRLRRITTDGRFIPELDGFRLLAILVVINEHVWRQVARPLGAPYPAWLRLPDGGTRGVLLFFTISGFILGLPFARRALLPQPVGTAPFSYGRYLLRRVTRLEPPYILALCARFALILLAFHEDGRALLPHLLASLFYVHNLVFGTMSRVSPPTWSLEVEVQYYLLAPLFAAVFLIPRPALRRVLLLGVILTLGIATSDARGQAPRIALSLAGNLQYFAAGLLLCDLYLTQPLRRLPAWLWDIIALAALVPLLWSESAWVRLLFPLGSVAIFLGGLNGLQVRRFFAAPVVSVAGGMCYSLYLTHGTVLALVASVLAAVPGPAAPAATRTLLVLGASLAATFAVGVLFYVLIERPCMDPAWPRKAAAMLWPRRRRTAPA